MNTCTAPLPWPTLLLVSRFFGAIPSMWAGCTGCWLSTADSCD